MYAILQHITRQSEPKQPQAVTLANPFKIPMHRKKQRSKKIRVKDSVASVIIREFFLTFVLWPQAHRTNYGKACPSPSSYYIYYPK